MKKILITLACLAALAIAAAVLLRNDRLAAIPSPASESIATSTNVAITIRGYEFMPATVTIKAGTKVTWTNTDIARHTVSADDNSFGSPFFGKGESYSHVFSRVGEFSYHCDPHPYMKAKIVVTR